jgi:cell division protein FtsQ
VKYATFGLLAAVLLYRGSAIVAQSRLLRIDRIIVRGNTRVSSEEVISVLNGLRGENLVWTDLDAWRARLLASPWLRDAALRRTLPSTVEVFVSEREPIGIGRVNGALYLVDDRGVIIDEYGPQYADFDLPIIDGLASAGPATAATDDHRAELAARVIMSLRASPRVAGRLSQVDVRDPHNAAVILSGDTAVIYVGEDRFLQRLQAYLELSGALHERVTDIDYIDLRFDDRIYVRPAGKPARAAAADRARSVPGHVTRSGTGTVRR